MFARIVVPVDFSPRSLRAARAAARIAAGFRSRATVLHVIERIQEDDSAALARFYRKLERAAKRRISDFLLPFEQKRLPAQAEIVYGKPVNEILRFANMNRADLIVVSSHRLPAKLGDNWGTVSYKVGILARCPVLLVK